MNCIKCDAEIPEDKWTSKFGFCGTAHYVEYMNEHKLWSTGSPNYSQVHMDKILERMPAGVIAMGPFHDVVKYPWLDSCIKLLGIAWVLTALSVVL